MCCTLGTQMLIYSTVFYCFKRNAKISLRSILTHHMKKRNVLGLSFQHQQNNGGGAFYLIKKAPAGLGKVLVRVLGQKVI